MSGLPEGWAEAEFRDIVVDSQNGCSVRHGSGTPTVVLRLADVSSRDGAIATEGLRLVSLGDSDRNKYRLEERDLLAFRVNGSREIAGRVIEFRGTSGFTYCDHFIRIRVDRGAVVPAYAATAFASPNVRAQVEAGMISSAGQNTISQATLNSVRLWLPPLNEQKRIVAKLDALQARAHAAKQALDAISPLLEKFRQSVLAAAFRGDLTREWRARNPDVEPASELLARIRAERRRRWEEANPRKKYVEPEPVDTSELPELPEGWCWASWKDVGWCQNGRAFPSEEYGETGVKLLRPGNLHVSGHVFWTDDNTRRMPESWAQRYPEFIVGSNELVMNLTAQSLKDEFLGRVCLTGPDERCLLNQRIARLTPVLLGAEFCLVLFKSPVFRRYVDSGLNTGSLIQHIFTTQVNDFVFPLPPQEEHAPLVSAIRSSLELVNRVDDSVVSAASQLKDLRRSTLAKAFRGELVPQDPNDEPASVLLERIHAERAASEGNGKKARARARK